MAPNQLEQSGLQWIPEAFNLQQYYSLVTDKSQYFSYLLNSIKVVGTIIFFQVIFGVSAAFALAKLNIPYKRLIMTIYLLTLLMPIQVTMVPNFLFFEKLERILHLHILNTHVALVLPGAFSAFGIFMMKQFIEGIPDEIIEAARIEGAGTFRILFQMIVPILKPAIHALIVLTFIDNWNIIETALVFISDEKLRPLSAFLEQIYNNNHSLYYAGAVLYLVPAIFIFLKGEKYLEKGFSMGESDI
jgi:multiple sugar transport system permease protein